MKLAKPLNVDDRVGITGLERNSVTDPTTTCKDGSWGAGIESYDRLTGAAKQVSLLNEAAAGGQFDRPDAQGEWETSGIVEAPDAGGTDHSEVQAVVNANDSTGGLSGSYLSRSYVEGGQMLLAKPNLIRSQPIAVGDSVSTGLI